MTKLGRLCVAEIRRDQLRHATRWELARSEAARALGLGPSVIGSIDLRGVGHTSGQSMAGARGAQVGTKADLAVRLQRHFGGEADAELGRVEREVEAVRSGLHRLWTWQREVDDHLTEYLYQASLSLATAQDRVRDLRRCVRDLEQD